ncbi:DUF2442 domain-containing protein [Salmonella enterica]
MNTSSTDITKVFFHDDGLWLDLADGRTIGAPLAWFPKLLNATPEEREQFEICFNGVHWEALDEDICAEGLLAGYGDKTNPSKQVA